MRPFKTLGAWFTGYPFFATALIVAVVAAHFFLTKSWPILNVAAALAHTPAGDPQATLTSLALGVATVSAMVGGFAGVVVIFGLGSENDRFRLLRRKGANRLRANWISVVLSSFAGAFGSLVAAVLVVGFSAEAGMWVLEACLLITAHAAIRLTALLAGLAGIVDSEDKDHDLTTRTVRTADVLDGKPPVR